VIIDSTGAPCSTCGRDWSPKDFYATSTECRPCKRDRSRTNRALAARKIALAERLIDALIDLAAQGWRPPTSAESTAADLADLEA
jgi:hypothetical protein